MGIMVALFFLNSATNTIIIKIIIFILNGKQNRRNIVQIISIDNQEVITTKK